MKKKSVVNCFMSRMWSPVTVQHCASSPLLYLFLWSEGNLRIGETLCSVSFRETSNFFGVYLQRHTGLIIFLLNSLAHPKGRPRGTAPVVLLFQQSQRRSIFYSGPPPPSYVTLFFCVFMVVVFIAVAQWHQGRKYYSKSSSSETLGE